MPSKRFKSFIPLPPSGSGSESDAESNQDMDCDNPLGHDSGLGPEEECSDEELAVLMKGMDLEPMDGAVVQTKDGGRALDFAAAAECRRMKGARKRSVDEDGDREETKFQRGPLDEQQGELPVPAAMAAAHGCEGGYGCVGEDYALAFAAGGYDDYAAPTLAGSAMPGCFSQYT